MKTVAFLLILMTALAPRARAQTPPLCNGLGLPNPVYLQVGDTQQNLMRGLGRKLRDEPTPITLFYVTGPSCANIASIYPPGVAIKANTVMSYIQSKADLADGSWSLATSPLQCSLDADKIPDVANSAVFNSACTAVVPTTVHLTEGPRQAYVLAVPTASSQTAITFEEAYFVFGFGTPGMVTPWADEAQLFIRPQTASTVLAWAANIGVPAAKWKGVKTHGTPAVNNGSPDVVNGVVAGGESTIGILGAEVFDANRAKMKALAFRAKGQYAAYFPDSTQAARDKQNVRDGHYTVWSPTIWMDTVTVDGNSVQTPVNPTARYVIDLIAGNPVTPAPTFQIIDIDAAVGAIPTCAMKVSRAFEGGPLTPFTPPTSCTCKYDSLVDLPPSCAACTTTCATGVCRNGYCEDH